MRPKFLVEMDMDGYETEQEMEEACIEFIKDQLDFSASSVGKVRKLTADELKLIGE